MYPNRGRPVSISQHDQPQNVVPEALVIPEVGRKIIRAPCARQPSALTPLPRRKLKLEELERFDFMLDFGRPIEEAARKHQADMDAFTKQAKKQKLYEWKGINMKPERISFGMKENILVRLFHKYHIDGKPQLIPDKFTLSKLKQLVEEMYKLPAYSHTLEWRLADEWVVLRTPEDWDLCVNIWNKSNEEFLDIRVLPEPKKKDVGDTLPQKPESKFVRQFRDLKLDANASATATTTGV